MLEWLCPKCGRDVDPALKHCPFCGYEEGKPQAAAALAARGRLLRRRLGSRDWWADVDRGFRFGLGFIASLAAAYFVLYLIAYYGGHGEWAERLAEWLRLR